MKFKNKYIVLLFVSVFFTFCTSNTILKEPKNLISKDQMVEVLSDMLLANGGSSIKNLNLERSVNYYPLVFEKHQIDSARFSESNHFYISRIDDYNDILAKVNEQLTLKKENLQLIIEVQDSIKRVQDSIKRHGIKIIRDSINRKGIKFKRDSISKKMIKKKRLP